MVIGLDEAGRGAWAGPLVVAAVGLNRPIAGLNDSKVLSAKRRTELALVIQHEASFVGYGQVEAIDIDTVGLSSALRTAMSRAVRGAPAATIIVDGPVNYLDSVSGSMAQIDADALVPSVMAASILAKVRRDSIMHQAAKTWPEYGFERHVGYGTAFHMAALKEYGSCSQHRQSFKPIAALAES